MKDLDKKLEEVSFRGFLRFTCEHLRVSYEAITDTKRKNPVISKDTVANALLGSTALGSRSLREADFLGRQAAMRGLWGGGPSDTTLSRVAGGFQGTEEVLKRLWQQLRSSGYLTWEGEHVDVIDGTGAGGQLVSVLATLGQAAAIRATEPIPGTGHELTASIGLIERLALEGRLTDYLLGDGLYACERYWKACDQARCYGVVKTSDAESFTIIQQARLLFDYPIRGEQVGYQYAEGLDEARACRWRIWQTTGLWSPYPRRLVVARVEETFLKGKRGTEVFWILCQDLTIDPQKLLRLMHARWFIENNVFKAFNDQAHSKHIFSHDSHTARVLMHLQALAFMALGAYRAHLARDPEQFPDLWDHGQIPLRLLQSIFRFILSPADTG